MTKAQKAELKKGAIEKRLSECRQRLNVLLGVETRSTEEQTELSALTAEVATKEPEFREAISECDAAIAAAPDPQEVTTPTGDPETRERLELRSKARVSDFLVARLRGQPVTGASLEYSQAEGCEGAIPPSLLRAPETRADAFSPAPATHPTMPNQIQGYAYPPPIHEYVGVQVVPQAEGDAAYPVVTSALTGGMAAAGVAADSAAAALTITKHAADRRLQTRLTLRREDLAAYPQIEAALKMNLQLEQDATLDDQVLTGDDSSPNLDGLEHQVTVTAEGTSTTFDLAVGKVAALVDGLYATDLKAIRLVVNESVAGWMMRTWRGTPANGGPNEALWSYLSRELGGLRASKRMPASASSVAWCLAHRMGVQGQLGVVTNWGGTTIEDIYSDSKSGLIHCTAVQVVQGVGLLRSDAWKAISIKTA